MATNATITSRVSGPTFNITVSVDTVTPTSGSVTIGSGAAAEVRNYKSSKPYLFLLDRPLQLTHEIGEPVVFT